MDTAAGAAAAAAVATNVGRVPEGPAHVVAGVYGVMARAYARFRLGCAGLEVERGR